MKKSSTIEVISRKLSVVENRLEKKNKLKQKIDQVLGGKRHYKYCPCCKEYDKDEIDMELKKQKSFLDFMR